MDELRASDHLDAERKQVRLGRKRLNVQEGRLTDAYLVEAMDLARYKQEMDGLRGRRGELERAVADLEGLASRAKTAEQAMEKLEKFSRQVAAGLHALSFDDRQQLLRLVVERITVDDGRARVEMVVPPGAYRRIAYMSS